MEKTKNIAPHVMACKRCEGKGRIFYLDQGGAPLSAQKNAAFIHDAAFFY